MFEPESGGDLNPEDGAVTIEVFCQAPAEWMSEFIGEIKITNLQNNSNTCIVNIELKTPFYKTLIFVNNLFRFLNERFPNAFPIIRYILS